MKSKMILFFLFMVQYSFGITDLPPNILLITMDDLNCSSVGVYGNKTPGITPNIDKLASEGLMFKHAHVQVAVCQPSRNVLATGMYSHKTGVEGFYHIPDQTDVPIVYEILKQNGYLTGVMAKVEHSMVKENFEWDMRVGQDELGMGRDAQKYYEYVKDFLSKAKTAGKPFYLMANSQDPHRPFYRSDQERQKWGENGTAAASRVYTPEEVTVPDFLPDLPQVRQEIAEYSSSVRRGDDIVGGILKALAESGMSDNTVVVLISDNGMSFPFAKTNCYLNSTHTPWIVRWPNVVKPGSVDGKHLISAIDFLPSVLDIAHIKTDYQLDGKSIIPLLKGKSQSGRDYVFTQFFETSASRAYPMRSVQDRKYGYIVNFWSDGKEVFKNESQNGRTFAAMQEAAAHDPLIDARVELFTKRTLEEFYDLEKDPDALHNLIDDPDYQELISSYRQQMEDWMVENNDHALEAYVNRQDPAVRKEYLISRSQFAMDMRKKNSLKKKNGLKKKKGQSDE